MSNWQHVILHSIEWLKASLKELFASALKTYKCISNMQSRARQTTRWWIIYEYSVRNEQKGENERLEN